MTADNTNQTPPTESDYADLDEVIYGYLKNERPIDDVLKHPDFQQWGLKRCIAIVRDEDRGRELFQELCAQYLRRDREESFADCAKGLRAADIHTPGQLKAYLSESAKNLACSEWRKINRRDEIAPTSHLDADELSRVKAEGVSPDDQLLLVEALGMIDRLPKEYHLILDYWLQDYSTRDIAERLGCSHVAVQNRLKAVFKKLRSQMVVPREKAS